MSNNAFLDFRACLCCRPQYGAKFDTRQELVDNVCHLIKDSGEETLSLAALASQLRISPSHLQRTFKKATGISPTEYAHLHRVNKFKANVKSSGDVTEAIYDAVLIRAAVFTKRLLKNSE